MSGGKRKSTSKSTSISHQALDGLVKFQTSIVTDLGKFKTEVIKSVQEIAEKHNELGTHLAAVDTLARNAAAFAASEIGKMGGTVQHQLNIVGQATNAIDLNVLALAELTKEVVGQLTQIDTIFKKLAGKLKSVLGDDPAVQLKIDESFDLSADEVSQVKENAIKWYTEMVAFAFKSVQDRLAKEDQERKEAEAAAQKAARETAEAQAAAEAEPKTVEDELRKANMDELTVAAHTSGGSGSPFPDGADIFGG
jgi:hypothetical protein